MTMEGLCTLGVKTVMQEYGTSGRKSDVINVRNMWQCMWNEGGRGDRGIANFLLDEVYEHMKSSLASCNHHGVVLWQSCERPSDENHVIELKFWSGFDW